MSRKEKKSESRQAEILQDGCFYNENLRTALSEYVYLTGRKDIVPHFTFYGYRYVKISGVTMSPVKDFTEWHSTVITKVPVDTDRNELVNQLISNVEWLGHEG